MGSKRTKSTSGYYNPQDIHDAPECYDYSRAMGILTRGTWNHGVRPVDQRIGDFMAAYPPNDPSRFSPGGSLVRQPDGTYTPGSVTTRVQRFLAQDWLPGSLHELLSRYGLKMAWAPAYQERSFTPDGFRDTARKRNQRLRVLHGGVDIEPADMDAAKAEFLDLQERKRAAEEVRSALKKMREELGHDKS